MRGLSAGNVRQVVVAGNFGKIVVAGNFGEIVIARYVNHLASVSG